MPIQPKKRRSGQLRGILHDIFVSTNPLMAPFGMVFVYDPENFEQQKLGTFFGIIKISDSSANSSYVANLLASVMKKEFFSKPDRPTFESLEGALKKANLALAEIARQGSVQWIGKISFAGGALEKNNLHFSKLGDTSILLLRGGMIADIGTEMGFRSEETSNHPLKTFLDISSGKLEKNDCLIFTTNDLLEIFSLEEIRQNFDRFSRDEFPEIITASLSANSELSGAIIANIISEEETILEKETIFEDSGMAVALLEPELPKIPEAEPEREPAVPPRLDIIPAASADASPEIGKRDHLFVSEEEKIPLKKSIGEKLKKYSGIFTEYLQRVFSKVDKKAFPATRREKIRNFALKAGRKGLAVPQTISRKISQRNWSMTDKKIWAGAGVFVLLFLAIYFFKIAGKNEPVAPASDSSSQTTPAIETALDDVQVKIVGEISDVAALPSGSREVFTLAESIFVLGPEKSVLKIDSSTGGVEEMKSTVSSGNFSLATPMPDLNSVFILTEDKKIISFTPINKNFQENGISFPAGLKAADIGTFLTYLYVFDPSANQIYRYPRAEGGFSEGQSWLKSGADIKDAKSFAINDDIYAASDSQITAYLQGRKDDKITFENPNVPLAVDKIFTAPNLERIYALDNKNRRVIAYSKDGKITAQYWNKSIAGIKDLAIDEKNKTIYLLKTDRLLKFNMVE